MIAKRKKYNRIKAVLAEKGRLVKWLAEQLDTPPSTVYKWTINENQPSIETFFRIAGILEVKVADLLVDN